MIRHMHIDPVGGLSGDMFLAALLGMMPDAGQVMQADLAAAGISDHITMAVLDVRKSGFAAQQMRITQHPLAPPTRHWRDIRAFLQDSALRIPVKTRALSIFAKLAEAEGICHGIAIDDVHFHEIADWDSVADIVAAASLIEEARAASWSVSDLPLGSGKIRSQHGLIPVPAPAVVELLKGFAFTHDGTAGERITPTGAAILRHLNPAQHGPPAGSVLTGSGVGAGSRDLDGIANIVRVLAFDCAAVTSDLVTELSFEIDDMTPEEISVALDHIRAHVGVVDAGYTLGYGKKGRVRYAVNVLCRADDCDATAQLCLDETSTLGLRIHPSQRRVTRREATLVDGFKAKATHRPSGQTTKVESDDLQSIRTLGARRRAAEAAND